eukprot:g1709.t1
MSKSLISLLLAIWMAKYVCDWIVKTELLETILKTLRKGPFFKLQFVQAMKGTLGSVPDILETPIALRPKSKELASVYTIPALVVTDGTPVNHNTNEKILAGAGQETETFPVAFK